MKRKFLYMNHGIDVYLDCYDREHAVNLFKHYFKDFDEIFLSEVQDEKD